MHNSNLKRKLDSLKTKLEESQREIQLLTKQRDEVLSSHQKSENSLRRKKDSVESLHAEVETFRSQLHRQEEGFLREQHAQLKEKRKNNQTVQLKIRSREQFLGHVREQSRKYEEMGQEIKEMEEYLRWMAKAQEVLSRQNLKIFMRKGKPLFPMEGTPEEKLEWVKAYGQFVERLHYSTGRKHWK